MRQKSYFLIFNVIFLITVGMISQDIHALALEPEPAPTLKVAVSEDESIVVERIVYNVLKRMEYQMIPIRSGMRTVVTEVNNGDIAVLAAQAAGLEKEYPNLIRIPISNSNLQVEAYTRDNYDASKIKTWQDLAGLRVGSRWQDMYVTDHIPDTAAAKIVVSEYQELWQTLFTGETDVVLLPNPENSRHVPPRRLKKAAVIEEIPVYTYFNKRYADLIPEYMRILTEMNNDGLTDMIENDRLTSSEKLVLHITSYNSNLMWERKIIDGVKKGLKLGEDTAYCTFNLNYQNMEDFESKSYNFSNTIRTAFLERSPDVIIISDNGALKYIRENYFLIFQNTPIVFCGINNFDGEMLYGIAEYATGCSEEISANTTVQQMLKLYPKTKNIFVINDYTDIGRSWQKDISSQLSHLNLDVKFIYNENITKNELLKQVASFGEDTLVLLGSYYYDSRNVYVSEEDIQSSLYGASGTPVFTLMDTMVGSGALGGMLVNAERQGIIAGEMARKILEGESVSSIPVKYASESINEWIFDQNILRKFGISEKKLPEGAVIINKSERIWEVRPVLSVFILALIMGLMGIVAILLLWQRKHKRLELAANAEAAISGGEQNSVMWQIENIMGNAPLAFAIIASERILESNKYSEQRLGMLAGLEVKQFYKNPEIHDKMMRELEMRETLIGEIVLFTMLNGEAHRHYVNFSRIDYKNEKGCLLFAVDIEEMESQKDFTKRSQDDLQKIIDALPTAMAIVNTGTCDLEYANKEFLFTFGYETTEEARYFDFQPIVEQVFAGWQGSTVSFEYDSPFAQDHGIHLKMFADQIMFRGKYCIILIAQDISVEIENAEVLKRAAEKEKEANLLKGVFLANMSHEIRTPMNAIIGLAQLALMKEQTPENNELFYKINLSAKNLLSIINDILDFSKIEAEKLDFVEEEFALEEIITNAFLVATERIEDKNLEILLDVEPEVPYYLFGDKIRLWQVLKNILDNSVKYTPEGKITLTIGVISESESKITLCFNVTDTGIGMSEEQLQRLFTPFEQFQRNNSKKAGTGLGMSITKQLVELMQGEIRVTSKIGEGTSFHITLPFVRSSKSITIEEFAREAVGRGLEDIKRILLVDDEEYALKIMSNILKRAGVETECLTCGDEAVRCVQENQKRSIKYDAAIIDYQMEDGSGVDIGKRISTISPDTKLLLVTAYSKDIPSHETIKEAGFQDMIEKPFIVSAFLQKVCSVIPENLLQIKERRDSYKGSRVLVCEDNEINQMVAIGLLENFDIIPTIANNGEEALAILEEQEFDLVLMDIIMPVMDGHETTQKIRSGGRPYHNVPIVAMTANVMPDEVEKCFQEGMNGHIEKPINIEKFQEILSEFLIMV